MNHELTARMSRIVRKFRAKEFTPIITQTFITTEPNTIGFEMKFSLWPPFDSDRHCGEMIAEILAACDETPFSFFVKWETENWTNDTLCVVIELNIGHDHD